jgi:MoxR-like ATPase
MSPSAEIIDRIRRALGGVIHGKADVIELLLVGVLGGGHVLVEDVPGVGKTTLAKALARVFRIAFARVQFTPDLLPADVIGAQVLDPKNGTFAFHRGPVFTNVLLADEINRASPRTQSALLEAMNEAQATVDGVTYPLPRPFFVVATQNPVDYQGTYPLPEAQLDRFLLRIGVGYPPPAAELEMLFARQKKNPLDDVEPIADEAELLAMQAAVRDVDVKESVAKYMLRVIAAPRATSGSISARARARRSASFARRKRARTSRAARSSRPTTCKRSRRRSSRTACSSRRKRATAASRASRSSRRLSSGCKCRREAPS